MSRHGYLLVPSRAGFQPPHRANRNRAGYGRLRFHALGCRADGGDGLPPGTCGKCVQSATTEYRDSLMRLDRRVLL